MRGTITDTFETIDAVNGATIPPDIFPALRLPSCDIVSNDSSEQRSLRVGLSKPSSSLSTGRYDWLQGSLFKQYKG